MHCIVLRCLALVKRYVEPAIQPHVRHQCAEPLPEQLERLRILNV
jgi:hypothetical protein